MKTWARFGAMTAAMLAIGAGNIFAQEGLDTVRVLFRASAAKAAAISATLKPNGECPESARSVQHRTSGRDTVFAVSAADAGSVSVSHERQRQNAQAMVRYNRGSVSLSLQPQQYGSADISLYAINGKRVLRSRVNASSGGTHSVVSPNLSSGVYMLSVRGINGNAHATRLAHSGGRLSINAAFDGESRPLRKIAAIGSCASWTLTLKADGYEDRSVAVNTVTGARNGEVNLSTIELREIVTPVSPSQLPGRSFKQEVGSASFDMVYIPGGTFTLGCDADYRAAANISSCPANTGAVQAEVSSYYIAKTTVPSAVWSQVMGSQPSSGSYTWYHAMEFACRLSKMTGRNYRMLTEAEWEYAAKKYRDSLTLSGSGEEWAYNSWNASHSSGKDPVGSQSGTHTQKTRRNAQNVGDNITGRLIRSIDGVGPLVRMAISAGDLPPNYVPPCNLHAPELDGEPMNSYRDPRWITGGDARWSGLNLMVWEDGTARMGSNNGQWFTSNNIAFVFVRTRSNGDIERAKYSYIFLDDTQGSTLHPTYFAQRFAKETVTPVEKPAVAGLKSGEELAIEATEAATTPGESYMMVNMVNIPQSARFQDPRLLDGPDHGWFQHNIGSAHHYRKDVDPDEFRFIVSGGMLANGDWFTVNNTFLRVTHPTNGYVAEYLYDITSSGAFVHNSFMAYERADFRSFVRTANDHSNFNSCRQCQGEITKGQSASFYSSMADGHSTFTPAPCPAGGCR